MSGLPRSFIIFALCLPVALLLGVMMATPLDSTTLLFLGAAFLLLLSPILLTKHHGLLILSWNAFISVFFLPGQPYLWLLMTVVSLFFSILTRALNRERIKFFWESSIVWPVLALTVIVLVTAQVTGGIGVRALGSDVFGGRRYIYVLGALAGFFAIAAHPIPLEKRQFYAAGFFLPAITAFFSNVAFWLGPSFYWLFLLFPTDWVLAQVSGEQTVAGFIRVSGLAPATFALCSYLLLKYGVRGVFNIARPIPGLVFMIAAVAGLFSGFRSHIVLIGLLFTFQFFAEGLYRTRYLPILVLTCVLGFSLILPFADRLPLAAQRALTILPLDLDPVARSDAKNSLDWRFEMWKVVLSEVPKYLIVGKGYALNPTDIYLAEESVKRGIYAAYHSALIAGDYHSGPFSLMLGFGIFGTLAFTWLILAGWRVLYKNLRFGDPEILNINRFLLVYYLARLLYFIVIFGSLHTDLPVFTGIIAFSLSLNRGVRSSRDIRVVEPYREPPEPQGGMVPAPA
jgi:hypothetical protein